jgi:transcription antitermination factor NusB
MGKRHRARELAIQVLFHLEFTPGDPANAFDLICQNFVSPGATAVFARNLVLGICGKKTELDRRIVQASTNWRLERMSRLDRNILRLAVFEILFLEDIPPKVSIDEAVELAKKYGGGDSAAFVNGILDHVYNQMQLGDKADSLAVNDKIGRGFPGI